MLERAADQPLRLEHEILAGLQREVIREDMIQFAVDDDFATVTAYLPDHEALVEVDFLPGRGPDASQDYAPRIRASTNGDLPPTDYRRQDGCARDSRSVEHPRKSSAFDLYL